MASPTDICALCLQKRPLRDSHLIGAAVLRLLRDDGFKNPNPYIMSFDYVRQSSAQAKQHLLCDACEQLFNRNGEKWVAAHCFHVCKQTFRLKELLGTSRPILSEPHGEAYDASKIPAIDIEKLTYFATSVIWRASVSSWRLQRQVRQPLTMDREYLEEVRLYLLGGSFPQNAVLSVFVISAPTPIPLVLFPESLDEDSARVIYRFYVPGIWFLLCMGNGLTADDRNMCVSKSSSHPICVYLGADALPVQIVRDLYKSKHRL